MNLTDIFLKILSMSITASYCVLLICIARLFLRRVPKIFSYLLWSIVALRLVCPVSIESSFSLVGGNLSALTGRIEAGYGNFHSGGAGYAVSANSNYDDMGTGSYAANSNNFNSGRTDKISSGSNHGTDGISLRNGSISNGGTDSIGLSNGRISNGGISIGTGNSGSNHSNPNAGSIGRSDASNFDPNGSFTAGTDSNNSGLNDNGTNGIGSGSNNVNIIGTDTASLSSLPSGLSRISSMASSQSEPNKDSRFNITSDTLGSILPTIGSGNPLHKLLTAAACLWLTGMLGMFGYCILSYLRLYRRLNVKASYSCYYKSIPVYQVSGLDTPFVAGFFRPVIYLPAELEEGESCQCLAHEYTHILRKDHLIKQAAFLLVCVYWFQPFVWLAFHLMSKDMEMSCDEMALRKADLRERKAYSSTLVRLSSETHRFSGYPLAFSENNTSSRIQNILNQKKPAAWILAGCSVLLILFAAGLLTNPTGSGENTASPSNPPTEASGEISEGSLGEYLLYDPPVFMSGELLPDHENTLLNSLMAEDNAPGNNGSSPDNQQAAPAINEAGENAPEESTEDPYLAILQEFYPELQAAYQEGNTIKTSELRVEMKLRMASYWTALVEEQKKIEKEMKQLTNSDTGVTEEQLESVHGQLRLLQHMVDQAKSQMDYMNKTIDAITGSVNIVKAADYETAYPLSGVCTEDDIVVRSLPKESASQIDTLSSGDTVSIVSFGRYMLQEDRSLSDFLLSDAEIQQEYANYAVVLYHSEIDSGRTTRKGYVNIDALDISGTTPETYMHWIGKTWSEAFCSQDGSTLYQMAADKKSFLEWEYINGIQDTDPLQVEFNASYPYPRCFYSVTLLTDHNSKSLAVSGMDDIALQFFVETPKPGVWTQRQDLKIAATARELQNIRHIADLLKDTVFFSEIRNYEQVTSCREFRDAYLASPGSNPSYFDFSGSGYAASYNAKDSIITNTAGYRYELDSAESILQEYLNLSGGNAEADTLIMRLRDDDNYVTGLMQLTFVEYTFAKADEDGQNKITIPMYQDKYWYIWVPGQDEALDKVIYDLQIDF